MQSPDPRDFYASDSSVLDEYTDLDQDSYESEFLECAHPEVHDDDMIKLRVVLHLTYGFLI